MIYNSLTMDKLSSDVTRHVMEFLELRDVAAYSETCQNNRNVLFVEVTRKDSYPRPSVFPPGYYPSGHTFPAATKEGDCYLNYLFRISSRLPSRNFERRLLKGHWKIFEFPYKRYCSTHDVFSCPKMCHWLHYKMEWLAEGIEGPYPKQWYNYALRDIANAFQKHFPYQNVYGDIYASLRHGWIADEYKKAINARFGALGSPPTSIKRGRQKPHKCRLSKIYYEDNDDDYREHELW